MSDDLDPHAVEAADLMRRVRQAMIDQKISQSELARRTGLSRGYMSLLFNDRPGEANRRMATLPTALLLAHKVGVVRIIGEEDF